jgi:hypothetical protein
MASNVKTLWSIPHARRIDMKNEPMGRLAVNEVDGRTHIGTAWKFGTKRLVDAIILRTPGGEVRVASGTAKKSRKKLGCLFGIFALLARRTQEVAYVSAVGSEAVWQVDGIAPPALASKLTAVLGPRGVTVTTG